MNAAATSALNSARSFVAARRSTLATVLYVIVIGVVLYGLYRLLNGASTPSQVLFPGIVSANTGVTTPPRADLTVPLVTGGDFSLSTWINVTDWTVRAGKAKPVLIVTNSGNASRAVLVVVMHATQPDLMVRFATAAPASDAPPTPGAPGIDLTDLTPGGALQQLLNGSGAGGMGGLGFDSVSAAAPVCDVRGIDLQRWVLLTLVVSGQVVDTYVDGKLTRSCVLPGLPAIPTGGTNTVTLGYGGGFGGSLAGVTAYGTALTPDVVYSLYAAGPPTSAGATTVGGWIANTLGVSIQYANAAGTSSSTVTVPPASSS